MKTALKLLIYFLVMAFLILIMSSIIKGIELENGFMSALIFSLLLTFFTMIAVLVGLVARLVKYSAVFVTYLFIITFAMIWLTDVMYGGIIINGWIAYIVISFIPGISDLILRYAFDDLALTQADDFIGGGLKEVKEDAKAIKEEFEEK